MSVKTRNVSRARSARSAAVGLSMLGLVLTAAPASADTTPATAPAPAERITRGNLVIEGIPEVPASVRERLRQFSNVRTAGFADFAADGGIYISTRFGDTSQVHRVDKPLGARRQLTFFPEPIAGLTALPGQRSFLYLKDEGGDEFFQLWRFDESTGTSTQFTRPGTRNGALTLARNGRQMAWYEAEGASPDWDIFVASPDDPGSARKVLEGTGAITPIDITNDGRTILVGKPISAQESERYLLDVPTGSLRRLNPTEEKIAYGASTLTPDGKTALWVSNQGSDAVRIWSYDLASSALKPLTPDRGWEVDAMALSPDGRTIAYALNVDGQSEIYFLDRRTGRERRGPKLPAGLVGGLTFSPDSKSIGMSYQSASSPADAWTFRLADPDRSLTRWTQSEIGGLDPARFVTPELVRYPTFDEVDGKPRMIPAWVYRPKQTTPAAGKRPVLIQIHGGPEAQSRPNFSSTVQYWVTELGLTVISPNVRGSSGYGTNFLSLDNGMKREDSVKDIGALLDWIATQPDLDKDRVLVYGGSYGGYMVLASLVHFSDRLAGGINIVGISNFVTFLTNTMGYRRDLRRVEYGDERDPAMRAHLEKISPLNNVNRITRPLFIIQGLNDPRVPASEAEQILAAVRERGLKAWYLLAKDEGHGFRKKPNIDYQREAETLFITDVLGLDEAR